MVDSTTESENRVVEILPLLLSSAERFPDSDEVPIDEQPSPTGRLGRAWRWLFKPGDTLTSRAVNAGFWAYALTLGIRGLRTIRVVVLARILAPADFGLMAIALLTVDLINSFTNTGFDQALIQREGDIDDHLDAAWTVSIARGLALGAIVILGAPLIASFFHNPEATGILRVMGLSMIVAGFKNIGVIHFDKELQFRERFLFRSVPHIIETVVAIVLAIVLRSVWALVLGLVAREVSLVIASYIAHPYRPRLSADRARMVELYRFGIWVLGSAILSYLSSNLDDVIVGRILDATALGFYTNAFTLSSFTGRQMTGVISEVAFPAYSKLQSDIPRLRNAYFRTLRVVAVIAFPVATGLWLVGPELVETLMGAKWLPMIPAFNVLLIWGFLRSIGSTTGPLLLASGRPAINTKSQFAAVVLLAVVIYPFTNRWGIVGAGWATVVSGIGPVVVVLLLTGRYLSAERWQLLRTLVVPAVATILMAAPILMIKHSVPAVAGLWVLLWAPILGAVLYGGAILAARRYLDYQLG